MKSYPILIITLCFVLVLTNCKKDDNKENSQIEFVGSKNDDASGDIIRGDYYDFYIVGSVYNEANNSNDVYVSKRNLKNDVIWNNFYGTANEETGEEAILCSDGNLLISGTNETGLYVVKIDTDGNLIWTKTYNTGANSLGAGLVETFNGYIICGKAENVPTYRDAILLGIDFSGELLWQKTFAGTFTDGMSSVCAADSDDFFILGYTVSHGAGSRDLWLFKINEIGDTLWTKNYGTAEYEQPGKIIKTSDGNYVICAHSAAIDIHHQMMGMKIDEGGNVIWEQHWGGAMHDGGEDVIEDSDGNLLFLGQTKSNLIDGTDDMLLVKTDAYGNKISEKNYSAGGTELGYSLIQVDNSYYLLGDISDVGNGKQDMVVICAQLE